MLSRGGGRKEIKDYFSEEKFLIQNLRLRCKWIQITGNSVKALALFSISSLCIREEMLRGKKPTPMHKNLVGCHTRKLSIWSQ